MKPTLGHSLAQDHQNQWQPTNPYFSTRSVTSRGSVLYHCLFSPDNFFTGRIKTPTTPKNCPAQRQRQFILTHILAHKIVQCWSFLNCAANRYDSWGLASTQLPFGPLITILAKCGNLLFFGAVEDHARRYQIEAGFWYAWTRSSQLLKRFTSFFFFFFSFGGFQVLD